MPTKVGKLPSLARMMAIHGPGVMTMRVVKTFKPTEPQLNPKANTAEWHWDWLLSPTVNACAPYGGAHKLKWDVLPNNKHDRVETKNLKDRVLHVLIEQWV